MKKIFLFFVTMFLLFGVSCAWAEKYHSVVKGDCLWTIGKKYESRWQEIQRANGLRGTVIFPGQRLLIPDAKADAKTSVGKSWEKIGGNPYKGTAEWAIRNFSLPEEIKTQVLENIRQEKFAWSEVRSGQKFSAVTFGRNKIWDKVETRWDSIKIYIAKDYGVGEYHVIKVLWCGNWAWWKEEVVLPPKKEIPPVSLIPEVIPETPPEIPSPIELPPIFREVVEEKECVQCEHEVDAGTGVWQNKETDARGLWWYAQYLLTLQRCEDGNMGIFGGTAVPKVGVFAKGDLGETDANYSWNSWGVGPEIGFIWTGLASNGYPHQVQFMFRTLWEHLHGENSSSGYHKDENHFLLGYYAEYLRKIAPDLMTVLYTEGWFDVSGSIDSSWSGDRVSDRSGFAIGAKIHKDFSEDWAGRLGAQIGFTPHEDHWGLNLNAEARFREWLMLGPNFDYTLASAVAGAAGGFSYGPFVRFELKHEVRRKYSEVRMEQVKPADHELLQY